MSGIPVKSNSYSGYSYRLIILVLVGAHTWMIMHFLEPGISQLDTNILEVVHDL